jgi:hypothetical protein
LLNQQHSFLLKRIPMADRSRISGKIPAFASYIVLLDKLQLSPGDVPGTLKWQQWQWSEEESQQISAFRTESDDLYKIVSDPAACTSVKLLQMKTLIKRVRAYDNDKLRGHHLLDKIGLFGNVDDCMSANVKQGTSLAAQTNTKHEVSETLMPTVVLQNLGKGFHKLRVYHTDNTKKRALPKGVFCALILRYIGTEPPASKSGFDLIGAAKNGYFISYLRRDGLDPNIKYFAYYYGVYLTNKGKLLHPSGILQVQAIM